MTEEAERALVEAVKAITDRLNIVDEVFRQARLGVDMRLVFMCGASGLYYPQDYAKEWGRLYGIGLGPDVCSESLQSLYEVAPPAITPEIRRIEQIMHPVAVCKAQMDAVLVDARALEGRTAVLDSEDRQMEARATIVRNKQLANPRGRLRNMVAAWEGAR